MYYNKDMDYNVDPPAEKGNIVASIMYEERENVWNFMQVSVPLSEVNMKYIGEYEDF